MNEVQKTTARVDVKWSAMSPEDHPMPGGPQRSTLPTPIPMAHMTKAERKRLQWERERGVCLKSLILFGFHSSYFISNVAVVMALI